MKITKWGEYGILCSLYLAHKFEDQEPCGAAEIAEMQAIPQQYTQQILHRLKKGMIVESIRGPRGGYRLAKAPEEISLRQVLVAAEGSTFEVICDLSPLYADNCGEQRKCGLRPVWQDLQRAIDEVLESKTLATVLAGHNIVNQSKQIVPAPSSPRLEAAGDAKA